MQIRVILNPKAGGKLAGRNVGKLRSALERAGAKPDIVETTGPGHASELARIARKDGVEVILACGGDGTINEIAQAYVSEHGEAIPGPALALLPAGTGGDLRKTFQLGDSIEDAVQRALGQHSTPIDLGILRLLDHAGKPQVRAFVNITSFGLGGLTDRIVNSGPKWMGGKAAFLLGALRALSAYENQRVKITLDGQPWLDERIVNVAIANGKYFGGGMKIAPDADPSDGWFDVVAIGDLSVSANLALTAHIYQGTHITQPQIRCARARVLEAEPSSARDEVLIDMDGETPGRLPLRAEVAPQAIELKI